MIAPQFTFTRGRPLRELRSWIARATSSLPDPVSPRIRTVESNGCDDFDLPQHFDQRGAVADHLLEVMFVPNLLLKINVLGFESGSLIRVIQRESDGVRSQLGFGVPLPVSSRRRDLRSLKKWLLGRRAHEVHELARRVKAFAARLFSRYRIPADFPW